VRINRRVAEHPFCFGGLLRHWRKVRNLTQAELAFACTVSTRHLSFLESGRASPSAGMVLALAKQLRMSSGERNRLLLAAGFAPRLYERAADDPDFLAARKQLSEVLRAQAPKPSLAFDRHWNLVDANRMVGRLLVGVESALLPPRRAVDPGCGTQRVRWRVACPVPNAKGAFQSRLAELYKELNGLGTRLRWLRRSGQVASQAYCGHFRAGPCRTRR
jgi:transcriptional regulator with XRE-family HTH domain